MALVCLYNSGVLFYAVLPLGGLIFGIRKTYRNGKVISPGFADDHCNYHRVFSFSMIVIRSR
jgi:hypothetical protein